MAENWFADAWANPKFKQFVSEAGQDLGYGLANSTNLGNAFGAAARRGAEMQPTRDLAQKTAEEEEKRVAQINATAEFLRSKGAEDLAAAVEGGMTTGADAFNQWYQQANAPAGGADAPSNVQEWQYYSQLTPEQQSQYLTMKRSNSPLNIGTGFVTQDMANPGQIIGGPIAIENQQAAYDTSFGGVEGKADAENAALAESVQSKLPGLRTVINELTTLADTATYTQSGQAMDALKRELGLPVGQGAIDRASYIAIVDNQVLPLLRDTFGAAFTQKEGETLRATLGDPNKSPAEKKAILEAFIAQKERDVAGMTSRMPVQGGGTGGYTVLGVE